MLKCPFCGNENVEVVLKSDGLHGENGTGYIVRCNYLNGGCGANGGARPTKEEAVKTWDQRIENEEIAFLKGMQLQMAQKFDDNDLAVMMRRLI